MKMNTIAIVLAGDPHYCQFLCTGRKLYGSHENEGGVDTGQSPDGSR